VESSPEPETLTLEVRVLEGKIFASGHPFPRNRLEESKRARESREAERVTIGACAPYRYRWRIDTGSERCRADNSAIFARYSRR
jgi:predicted Zn-dependent protease